MVDEPPGAQVRITYITYPICNDETYAYHLLR